MSKCGVLEMTKVNKSLPVTNFCIFSFPLFIYFIDKNVWNSLWKKKKKTIFLFKELAWKDFPFLKQN